MRIPFDYSSGEHSRDKRPQTTTTSRRRSGRGPARKHVSRHSPEVRGLKWFRQDSRRTTRFGSPEDEIVRSSRDHDCWDAGVDEFLKKRPVERPRLRLEDYQVDSSHIQMGPGSCGTVHSEAPTSHRSENNLKKPPVGLDRFDDKYRRVIGLRLGHRFYIGRNARNLQGHSVIPMHHIVTLMLSPWR